MDWSSLGAMIRRCPVLATLIDGRPAPSRSDNQNRTATVYSRCASTYTSGVATGLAPITAASHLIGIRGDRKRAAEKHRAEVPGGTTSRSPDVRHVPAFRRNSNTRITASGWPAARFAEPSALSHVTA